MAFPISMAPSSSSQSPRSFAARRAARRAALFFASRLILAAGIAASALIVFLPKNTHADDSDEVNDWERAGEYVTNDEGEYQGQMFGKVLVKGELKSTATGWVLVRTFENQSDEPQTAVVEEKLSQQLTANYARVSPPSVTLILRTQKVALKPHEKKSIGIIIPPAISAEMDRNAKIQAAIAQEQKRMAEDETGEHPMNLALLQRTYTAYNVGYLSPLPPGKRAARDPNEGLVTKPEFMPEPPPLENAKLVAGSAKVAANQADRL